MSSLHQENIELTHSNSKRQKCCSGNVNVDVFKHEELFEQIGSYLLSPPDLCALDLVSKSFRASTRILWSKFSSSTFGLADGKGGWRLVASLLRPPIMVNMTDDDDFGFGCMYGGIARVTTNQSIVVAVTDDDVSNAGDRRFPSPHNCIGIRDAYSLNYFRTLGSPMSNWRVAICGKKGAEIIVTTNYRQLVAQQGDDVQHLSFSDIEPQNEYQDQSNIGIPCLGCESHLLIAVKGGVRLFEVVVGRQNVLLNHVHTASITNLKCEDKGHGRTPEDMSWSHDRRYFAICFPWGFSLWNFDAESNEIELLREMQHNAGVRFTGVTLSRNFAVVAVAGKKMQVYDRESFEKIHTLCDVEVEDGQLDEFETKHPISMTVPAGGDLLVTSSHLGNKLCVWNLRSGELLKVHNDAIEQQISDEMPYAIDVTSMVHLESLNAFIAMNWSMCLWGFPTSPASNRMLSSIRRRELQSARGQLADWERNGDSSSDDCSSNH